MVVVVVEKLQPPTQAETHPVHQLAAPGQEGMQEGMLMLCQATLHPSWVRGPFLSPSSRCRGMLARPLLALFSLLLCLAHREP